MLVTEIGLSLVIAAVMTLLAVAVCFNLGIETRALRLYLLLVGGTLGGGHLAAPAGPLLLGVPWLPLFLAGLVTVGICLGCSLLSRQMTAKIATHLDGLASGNRFLPGSSPPSGLRKL